LLDLKILAPNVCRKTSEDHFVKGHTKNGRQKLHKNFVGTLGNIWAKILCTSKNLLVPTPMSSIPPLLELSVVAVPGGHDSVSNEVLFQPYQKLFSKDAEM